MASPYTPEEKERVKAEVLEAIAGGTPLSRWCIDNNQKYSTVHAWLHETEADKSAHVRARELGAHKWIDDCMEIADELDTTARSDKNFDTKAMTAVARVRIDTRLRMAGLFNRAAYGAAYKGSGDEDGGARIHITGGLPDEQPDE